MGSRAPSSGNFGQVATDQSTESPAEAGDERFLTGRATRPVLGIIIATAVLYYARDILLPISFAAILAVVFSPIVRRLEPWAGRALSSAIVVITGMLAIAGIVYFVTVELTSVAVEVSSYSSNIAAKLSHLERSTPAWLREVESAFQNVEKALERNQTRGQTSAPRTVQTTQAWSPLDVFAKSAGSLISGIAEAVLIIVLLFFLLYSRTDLRDRFVRLSARAGIPVAAQAIDAAGSTVSRYLFLFSVVNLSFGLMSGVILWFLGMPNPELWGTLGFLLRYIPYIGATAAALIPTMVAFAVFPGWAKAIEVVATFVLLDQLAAQFVEPFFIGAGVGVSPVALLFSAAYWTWLWGPAGLVIATPLTACIKVVGDYIPSLDFFSLLLGADVALEDYHDYYRKLLELDRHDAEAFAIRYCDEHGLEATFREIFAPALQLAGQEFEDGHLDPANLWFIIDTTRELIAGLGSRFSKPQLPASFRVLGICAPGDSHSLGLMIVLELLRLDGVAASFAGENKSLAEIREFANRYTPDLICLSCTLPSNVPTAIQTVRALKDDRPQLIIIAGGPAAVRSTAEFLGAGCARVCANDNEGRRAVRQFALNRSRSRPADSSRFPTRLPMKREAR
jgi:predicted PurR-regulated permease PerM/methanogenic corrinoid protein MtbC1